MKTKISWYVLLWSTFIILITLDIKNLKYLFNLIKELRKIFKKGSYYTEDNDFVLIHKQKMKEF
jgi:queuine/archaeosine tRNA-ribosyltransferase